MPVVKRVFTMDSIPEELKPAMKSGGFNIIEYYYYKDIEKVAFLNKFVMDPSLVEERDKIAFQGEEYEVLQEFVNILIAVGRDNAPSNDWIKFVSNCYRPSRQDAPHLRLTLDDEFPKDPVDEANLALKSYVETLEDENKVGPNSRMANEKEKGNDGKNKGKKEGGKVSQEFMDNLTAVGRITGDPNNDWIKHVCSCYENLMTLDEEDEPMDDDVAAEAEQCSSKDCVGTGENVGQEKKDEE